ncbi:hypothetical protein N431DRAFT_196489 [Stipitochalara longipes BDJ]|nr:hypothetical protein N431DRAFT_196489 [Stipitochalara longipes BDJ]
MHLMLLLRIRRATTPPPPIPILLSALPRSLEEDVFRIVAFLANGGFLPPPLVRDGTVAIEGFGRMRFFWRNVSIPAEIQKEKLVNSNHGWWNKCTPQMCWPSDPNLQMRLRNEPINVTQVMQCDNDHHKASALWERLREHLLSPLLCCMLEL